MRGDKIYIERERPPFSSRLKRRMFHVWLYVLYLEKYKYKKVEYCSLYKRGTVQKKDSSILK